MRRAIQVRMIKDGAQESSSVQSDKFEEHAEVVSHAVNKTVKTITLAVFGYVALDTVRKVIVEIVSK